MKQAYQRDEGRTKGSPLTDEFEEELHRLIEIRQVLRFDIVVGEQAVDVEVELSSDELGEVVSSEAL